MYSTLRACLILLLIATKVFAYEPIPRRIPPAGKPVPPVAEAKLRVDLAALRTEAAKFNRNPLLPDVEIYLKAVELALEFGEFYKPKDDIPKAERALATARKRLDDLLGAQPPWELQRGLVVRGYRSKIDGSAQPYGLEIPESLEVSKMVPLYVWLHGRGDSQTDLHFLDQRSKRNWPFKGLLNDGIVLHPFGRQCIGYKSAGEIDVIDAVDHVIANYNVDPDRIALMGFSMGGAGAWHLGAHYAERWSVVHAGAGFVDVTRYQKLGPDQLPSAIEQTLWGLYDVPNYGRNLLNIPVVAYSGENDKQKDAADFMEEVLKANGHKLAHFVGPGMGHKYHPETIKEVAAFIRKALAKPKNRPPPAIHLQTRTLRYNKYAWIEITGLDKHWTDSRADAAFASRDFLRLTTKNVTSLRINRSLPKGCRIHIDGSRLILPAAQPRIILQRTGKNWAIATKALAQPAKSPQLQGPIDDAFLAPFLLVTPTGTSKDSALDQWVNFELEHFKTRWRALFRGDLRIKPDTAITAQDGEQYNLILFGTPESNKLISDALAQMPLAWPTEPNRVLLSIYPNPRSPKRYLVLNSGPTFREGHDRTNSLQNPKLGDWAIIDLSEPPGPERPGKIIRAGFFDENWQLP
jgi:pimeloyl-ACP methyl ester carboxylesterase